MSTAQAVMELPPQLGKDLLERIVARDRAALATLFDQTSGRLLALALAIVRNRQDAEEIVCDTFTQVWQDAHRYDAARGQVMGWLAVICRSRALDRRRQRRSPGQFVDTVAAEQIEDPQLPAVDLLSALEQGSRVRQALAALPPERRELIALAFLEGLSHQEIAARKQLPLGTVKSHLRRSLLQLREHLDAGGSA